MNERQLKAMFWLDECICGLVWDFRKHCTCGMWNERYERMSAKIEGNERSWKVVGL